jgi:hypothetical protein
MKTAAQRSMIDLWQSSSIFVRKEFPDSGGEPGAHGFDEAAGHRVPSVSNALLYVVLESIL